MALNPSASRFSTALATGGGTWPNMVPVSPKQKSA
jgi:hypothetical protein